MRKQLNIKQNSTENAIVNKERQQNHTIKDKADEVADGRYIKSDVLSLFNRKKSSHSSRAKQEPKCLPKTIPIYKRHPPTNKNKDSQDRT